MYNFADEPAICYGFCIELEDIVEYYMAISCDWVKDHPDQNPVLRGFKVIGTGYSCGAGTDGFFWIDDRLMYFYIKPDGWSVPYKNPITN